MTNFYPSQQLHYAISYMATSPSSIHDRLLTAFEYNLSHIKAEDLPESVRAKFLSVIDRLTKERNNCSSGAAKATIDKMTTDDAVEIAHDVFDIAWSVGRSL